MRSRPLTLAASLLGTVGLLGLSCSSTDETPEDGTNAAAVTWHRDVSPLVQQNCQSCHTEGGIAPFALTSYEDALAKREAIAHAVEHGHMPPWMPSDDCEPLQGRRRLSPEQVAVFTKWSEAGAPEGDAKDAVKLPQPEPVDLAYDAELKPSDSYTPNAQHTDDYRCFILDPALTQDRDLIAFQVVPGVPSQVHHVLVYATDFDQAEAQDAAEPGLGWTCFGGTGTQRQDLVGGWVPGTNILRYPPDTGIRIPANSALVMQVHYNLANGIAPDRTAVRLDYSDTPVPRVAQLLPLAESDFVLAPQTNSQSATETFTVPPQLAGTIWGVIPHMHTRGKRVTVKQNDKCLLDIPDWHFHWQQPYTFASPTGLPLQAGDVLALRCEWDNPTDKEVRWGEGSDDEMCLNFFYRTQ